MCFAETLQGAWGFGGISHQLLSWPCNKPFSAPNSETFHFTVCQAHGYSVTTLCLHDGILCNSLKRCREFPGGLVVRTPCFHCCSPGSIPGQGTEILQATRCSPREKKKDTMMMMILMIIIMMNIYSLLSKNHYY